jgi:putative oxidoreductase
MPQGRSEPEENFLHSIPGMDEFIRHFQQWPDGRASLALLLLRTFVGTAFVLHSFLKTPNLPGFARKFKIPVYMAAAAAYTQLVGGFLLILGLLTPIAGIAVAVTMVVAVSKLKTRGEKFLDPEGHSWESAGFYLVASIVIVLMGPGAYSLDRLLFG